MSMSIYGIYVAPRQESYNLKTRINW